MFYLKITPCFEPRLRVSDEVTMSIFVGYNERTPTARVSFTELIGGQFHRWLPSVAFRKTRGCTLCHGSMKLLVKRNLRAIFRVQLINQLFRNQFPSTRNFSLDAETRFSTISLRYFSRIFNQLLISCCRELISVMKFHIFYFSVNYNYITQRNLFWRINFQMLQIIIIIYGRIVID